MAKSQPAPVKATRVSFQILDAIRNLGGARVTELADYMDLPNSTVHDHLRTLEQEEYVIKQGQEYNIGIRFLDLGEYARQQIDIYHVAEPELRKLADDTDEHVNLMIEEHGYGVFLETIKGEEAVQLDTHAGRRVYLHTTSLGKAILAHTPRERVEEIIDRHGLKSVTDQTVSSREELFDELETVRERGYATDDEERIEGMRCVGAPVCPEDEAIAAISVSGPKNKFAGERFETELPELVLRTANVIEVNMKYR